MPDYRVTVRRTETRETEIVVYGMSKSDAEHMAIDQAADVDFHDCRVVDSSYEADARLEENEA